MDFAYSLSVADYERKYDAAKANSNYSVEEAVLLGTTY